MQKGHPGSSREAHRGSLGWDTHGHTQPRELKGEGQPELQGQGVCGERWKAQLTVGGGVRTYEAKGPAGLEPWGADGVSLPELCRGLQGMSWGPYREPGCFPALQEFALGGSETE